MKEINSLFQKKYFLTVIALFTLSFVSQFLFILSTRGTSAWGEIMMGPIRFTHLLFLILFVILYKFKYRIAFLFPALVLIDGFIFIFVLDSFESMPSWLILLFYIKIHNFF